ncbi:MAG: Gfo/Idh/MocA family oxidoreductase [Planctomycetes bacterium]|nr:Gfo/Idh/MocA family oxidoreductase [Planctomycetota bacterium]
MEPVKLGVIGCGVISGSHLKLAEESPAAEVVAVADLIEERAESRGEEFGIDSRYDSDRELLEDDRIEAVILAMPVADRTPVAYRALECGKHVLLEKPVAASVDEVEKMMELQNDRVIACCSPRMAFTGHAEVAARCVASGALGKIRVVRIRAVLPAPAEPRDEPPPWRESMKLNGGGILVNWSCYDLDYLMSITDWQIQPRTVLARWWPVAEKMLEYVAPGSDADAHYCALIQCEEDIILTMERAEFSSATSDQAWEIIGTEGTLHLPMRPQEGKPNAVILDRFVPGKGVESETLWEEGDGGGSGNVVNDFVRAIREEREPKTDIKRALLMQKITDAIYGSAESGQCVTIS